MKRNNFKNIFMVFGIAVAGFLGATSVAINSNNHENLVKEAMAYDTSGIEVGTNRTTPKDEEGNNAFYIGTISTWGESYTLANTYITRNGNGDSEVKVSESSFASVLLGKKKVGKTTIDLIKVAYDNTTTTIQWLLSRWSTNYYKTEEFDPKFYSEDGKVNTYLIYSDYGGTTKQKGFWTYLDEESEDESQDLYIDNNYCWGHNRWNDSSASWPYLIAYNSSEQKIYEAAAADIVEEKNIITRTRDGEDEAHYIYRFIDVPKTGVDDILVYFSRRNHEASGNNYFWLTNHIAAWKQGNENFFGSYDAYGPTNSQVSGKLFYENEAKAFIRGDNFSGYPIIDWTLNEGVYSTSSAMTGVTLPVEDYSFTKRGDNLYRLSLAVEEGSAFTYHTYDYLENHQSSGAYSSWDYNHLGKYGYDCYENGHISVYDEREDAENVVADPTKYIEK